MAPPSMSSGTHRTLEKLARSVQSGDFYEAQQMYKTVYARYMAAKKYTDALDLLQSGASVQLKHGQVSCGVELGMLLIEALSTAKISYSDTSLARIQAVFSKFPVIAKEDAISEDPVSAKASLEGVQAFMKAAIRWSAEMGGPSKGSPELHLLLAKYLWRSSEFSKASQHFVRGKNPGAFADAIFETVSECDVENKDILLVSGVLLYLSAGNLRDANKLLDNLVSRLGQSRESRLLASPLVQFTRFLLLTLERQAIPIFRMLRDNYKSSLERDPSLNELLDAIGERFYGLHRKNSLQGVFGDFMKMFSEN